MWYNNCRMTTPNNSFHTPRGYETSRIRAQLGLGVTALEGVAFSAALLAEAAHGMPNTGLVATLAGGFVTMVATGLAFALPPNQGRR